MINRIPRIYASVLSLTLILLIVAGQLVQYHHHDEHDEICLCLHPSNHCHDADHNDCDHSDDPACALHFEDSIIIDSNDQSHAVMAVAAVIMPWIYDLISPQDYVACHAGYICGLFGSGYITANSLRAPPVL